MDKSTAEDLARFRTMLDPGALDETALQACGLSFDDPAELAVMASIGLVVRLWRNTELEQAHDGSASRWWFERLHQAGLDEDSLERAWTRWREASGSHFDGLNAQLDLLCEFPEGSEIPRLELARAGLRIGYGVPDDVMFRINAATIAEMAPIVEGLVADPPTDSDWIIDLAVEIWNADRELPVGEATWAVADVHEALGFDPWAEELPQGVESAIKRLTALQNITSFESVVRFTALSAAGYAPYWAGTPWWARIVELMTTHESEVGTAFSPVDAERLVDAPATVSGPAARRRVKLHWSTDLEQQAYEEFKRDRRSAAGLPPDLEAHVPDWIVMG